MEWTWANERDDKEIKRWLKAVKRGKVASQKSRVVSIWCAKGS